MNPDYDPMMPQKGQPQRNAIIFRYGEILLNFAEAMNEAYGPDGGPYGTMTARWAVNKLRARQTVNMPEYPAGMTKDQFRNRIQNERRVELAFEGHRYFDVRRWKKISDLNEIRGVHIINDGGTIRYNRIVLESRQFEDKFYFFPIPYQELIKAPNLGQNPGWEVMEE
jgi:starch-binding outer membrane protein, SusD/RagB family